MVDSNANSVHIHLLQMRGGVLSPDWSWEKDRKPRVLLVLNSRVILLYDTTVFEDEPQNIRGARPTGH